MEDEIKQSTDYLKFHKIEGNRPLSNSHINSLVHSIKERNLLRLRPIIVDENMCVLDGQHRLEAARRCQVPIYYITCNSEKFKEITKLNQNQKNWKLVDFLNFYSISFKNDNYLKIVELINTYDINIECCFLYLNYNIKTKENRKSFCDGDFIFDKNQDDIAALISDWTTFYDFFKTKNCSYLDFFKTLHFRKALLEIIGSKKINRQQFWNRIQNNVSSLYRCHNKDDSIDMLLLIYNKQSPFVVKKEELYIE